MMRPGLAKKGEEGGALAIFPYRRMVLQTEREPMYNA